MCIQGWSTGLTFTYSSPANYAQGLAAVGNLGGSVELFNSWVNWHKSGTLFVPLPPGDYSGGGCLRGVHDPTGVCIPFTQEVGPGEPAPPTTCTTVALGLAAPTFQRRPWVSGMAVTMNGDCPGYWLASPIGTVNSVGGAALLGGEDVGGGGFGGVSSPINGTVVGIARTPDSQGYWLAASDGGVFTFGPGLLSTGDAAFYGSMGGSHLNRPVVGIAATADGKGYWLVASDGGVFAFGDAAFYGSTGGRHLNAPIVGMASTVDGKGYWLVASDGGVFAFGDAAFRGSLGGSSLHRPIVAISPAPDGSGYWLAASDGGVFAFGAPFLGSLGGATLSAPVVGISPTPKGAGYYLVGADSAVYAFGNARYLGAPSPPLPPFG